MGKTRIALEVAASLGGEHAGGVWLIELASLRDPRDVATAVATALGLDDAARLEPFLADKDVLLVVDNCEHVIDEAASVVERLLRAGAGVPVLATSRECLGVGGEVHSLVPPRGLDESSALFRARAEAGPLDPGTAGEAALIERICDRLERRRSRRQSAPSSPGATSPPVASTVPTTQTSRPQSRSPPRRGTSSPARAATATAASVSAP